MKKLFLLPLILFLPLSTAGAMPSAPSAGRPLVCGKPESATPNDNGCRGCILEEKGRQYITGLENKCFAEGEGSLAASGGIEIGETTAGRLGQWKVGVGNIFEDTYTDDKGRTHNGPTATLYLYHPEHGERELHAYPGKTFTLGPDRFEVSRVADPFFGKGHVVIIRTPKP
jgi:hypothetical protein